MTLARTILTGIILSAIPILSVASQSLTAPMMRTVNMPASIAKTSKGLELKTSFNSLSLASLAGVSNMRIGDVVYVHINQRGGEAHYAYAVSQNRPPHSDTDTLTLRGVVTNIEQGRVSLTYLFETLPPIRDLSDVIKTNAPARTPTPAFVEIGVNRRAVAHVRSVTVEGEVYPIR